MKHRYISGLTCAILMALILWNCDGGGDVPQTTEYPRLIAPDISVEDLVRPTGGDIRVELPGGVEVDIGSYNIYGYHYADAATIGAMLKDLNLDLIGMQEVPENDFDTLVTAAGFPYYVRNERAVALLSKTPIDDAESHVLDKGQGHMVIHATTVIDGATISVYATHIDWNAAGNFEARQLADELLANDPVPRKVMVGDFNDEHLSSQINEIDRYMTDVYTAAGWYPGQRISWPAGYFDDTEGSQLIDLIFYGNSLPALVTDVQVINLHPFLSDHKPVTARLLFPREDTPFAADPYAPYRDIYRDFPPEDKRPENLLVNPGAEDGLTGWTTAGAPEAVAGRENQSPRSGAAMFAGFSRGEGHISSAFQTVDLSDRAGEIDAGKGVAYIEGYTQCGYTMVSDDAETEFSNKPLPYDDGEIVVEALDAAGDPLARRSSARRDTLAWVPFAAVMHLPPGTRSLRYTWISHRKTQSGGSNDALFDDLYLGYAAAATTGGLLTGNLLTNPGAETGDTAGWEADGFATLPDLEPQGLAIYAPWAYSGAAMFFAGGLLEIQGGKEGLSVMAQTIDLTPWREEIMAGAAVRWGGRLRTWAANTHMQMRLEIIDGDGSLWDGVDADPLYDAEWTTPEYLTVVPPGASALRLVIETDVSRVSTGAFADDLFVHLETAP